MNKYILARNKIQELVQNVGDLLGQLFSFASDGEGLVNDRSNVTLPLHDA